MSYCLFDHFKSFCVMIVEAVEKCGLRMNGISIAKPNKLVNSALI